MPIFTPEALRVFAGAAMAALGFPKGEADLIARLLVEADLCGHETHGVRQIPRYMERIAKKQIVPGAPVTLVNETPATALLDGNRTLGFVAGTRAVELAVAKAREQKIAAVGVRNQEHLGRVGAYPEMVSREGLIGLAFVNAQGWAKQVTPFGGSQRRLGTNPIAAAFPNPPGPPILVDMATSAVAANKVRLAAELGKESGEGWIADKEGRPSRAPADFLDGLGMLLPLGGGQGHKGFALAVMVDLLAGVLAGSGTAASPHDHLDNGLFLVAIDPEAFLSGGEYRARVAELCSYLRSTPVAPGGPPVMMPGEYEDNNRREREINGIQLADTAWESLRAAAGRLGLKPPDAVR